MLKVLQVVPGLSSRHGGPSIALTDMTRLLCENGIDASMIATNYDLQGRSDVELGVVTKQRGARVIYHDIWPVNRWAFSFSLARNLLRTARDYDVMHIHWLFNFSSIMAAFAARRAGIPYVFQPNGSLHPSLMRKNQGMKNCYIRLLGGYILRHAAAISFASEEEKRLAHAIPPGVPAHVIPIGLDWREYEKLPARGLFRGEYPELAGKTVILFLSRISRQKGLDLLIPAFKEVATKHPSAHLVLAGPDGEDYGKRVREWIKTGGLEQRVTLTGRLPEHLKLAAYVDSDVFVLPSWGENFGAVVTEAMACRLPVVISNEVNICHEVAAAEAGVVVECTAGSVAAGLDRVLTNLDAGRAMGNKGRNAVREKFTWDVALRQIIPLYQGLASRDRAEISGK
jgi:glycosyltransferase involved in cell wall biosynthesis